MVADMIAKGELDPAEAAAATPIGRLGQGEEIAASVLWPAAPAPASSSASPSPSTAATPLNERGGLPAAGSGRLPAVVVAVSSPGPDGPSGGIPWCGHG